MGFFSGFLGLLFLFFFGGTGRGGRRRAGLFRTYGRNPFASRPIRGHQDPWSKRHTSPRNPFIGRKQSFPPKSGGRYLPKDPWKRKHDSVMGGSRHRSSTDSGFEFLFWPFLALFGLGSFSHTRGHSSSGRRSNPMTDDFYGHRGEFDTNDAVRARMEDMEQFYNGDHDFNAFEQGYDWDEIVDAVNDGYLPEDYLDNLENDNDDSYDNGYEDDYHDSYESEESYEQYDSYDDSYDD